MKKNEFTTEIKNKVLDLIAEEFLPESYDWNVTISYEGTTPSITLVANNGMQVWAIHQYRGNEQSIGTFLVNGDNLVCATVHSNVMEVSNIVRYLNADGKLEFAWDYIED